jgi:D-sedoheptulose 7-phosphate isomerase
MDYFQTLIERYPVLEPVKGDIKAAFNILSESFTNGGKLLLAGNGGSSADAEHIVGELMKSFVKKRSVPDSFADDIKKVDAEIAGYLIPRLQCGLPAISLTGHASLKALDQE